MWIGVDLRAANARTNRITANVTMPTIMGVFLREFGLEHFGFHRRFDHRFYFLFSLPFCLDLQDQFADIRVVGLTMVAIKEKLCGSFAPLSGCRFIARKVKQNMAGQM